MIWERTLTIYIDVAEEWLMGDPEAYDPPGWDDEMVLESPGWQDIEDDIRKAMYTFCVANPTAHPNFKFEVGWDTNAEKKD